MKYEIIQKEGHSYAVIPNEVLKAIATILNVDIDMICP